MHVLKHESQRDALKIVSKNLLSSLIFATFVLNVCLLVHHPMSLIILVKNGTEINSQQWRLVAVITSLEKHTFSEDYIHRRVWLPVKASTGKTQCQ